MSNPAVTLMERANQARREHRLADAHRDLVEAVALCRHKEMQRELAAGRSRGSARSSGTWGAPTQPGPSTRKRLPFAVETTTRSRWHTRFGIWVTSTGTPGRPDLAEPCYDEALALYRSNERTAAARSRERDSARSRSSRKARETSKTRAPVAEKRRDLYAAGRSGRGRRRVLGSARAAGALARRAPAALTAAAARSPFRPTPAKRGPRRSRARACRLPCRRPSERSSARGATGARAPGPRGRAGRRVSAGRDTSARPTATRTEPAGTSPTDTSTSTGTATARARRMSREGVNPGTGENAIDAVAVVQRRSSPVSAIFSRPKKPSGSKRPSSGAPRSATSRGPCLGQSASGAWEYVASRIVKQPLRGPLRAFERGQVLRPVAGEHVLRGSRHRPVDRARHDREVERTRRDPALEEQPSRARLRHAQGRLADVPGPLARQDGTERALIGRHVQVRGGARPAKRGLAGHRLLRAETRAEERRRGVAHGDGEKPPVPERLGHASALRVGAPERVDEGRCARLAREVREAHEPLVHLARRLHELLVQVAPHDEAALPSARS